MKENDAVSIKKINTIDTLPGGGYKDDRNWSRTLTMTTTTEGSLHNLGYIPPILCRDPSHQQSIFFTHNLDASF